MFNSYNDNTIRNKFYGQCKTGVYTPRNPEKYTGNVNNIVYRSWLEFAAFIWFDKHQDVLEWSSESVIIKYVYKGRQRRYFIDIYAKIKDKNNEITKYIIEIKPKKKLQRPKAPKVQSKQSIKNYNFLIEEYTLNRVKWEYAREYAEKRGYKFIILTEDTIKG
jgi:hypothetical protein